MECVKISKTSLVCGILSFVLGCIPIVGLFFPAVGLFLLDFIPVGWVFIPVVGLVLGFIAIRQGNKAKKNGWLSGTGFRGVYLGYVLGICALCLNVLELLFYCGSYFGYYL